MIILIVGGIAFILLLMAALTFIKRKAERRLDIIQLKKLAGNQTEEDLIRAQKLVKLSPLLSFRHKTMVLTFQEQEKRRQNNPRKERKIQEKIREEIKRECKIASESLPNVEKKVCRREDLDPSGLRKDVSCAMEKVEKVENECEGV